MEYQRADIGGHASVVAGVIVAYWLADGYVIGLPVAALAATEPADRVPWGADHRRVDQPGRLPLDQHGVEQLGERQQRRSHRTAAGQGATDARGPGGDALDLQRLDVRYAAAAALTCAIVTVTLGRSVGGRPLSPRRVRLAAVSYALFSVGLFTIAGVAAGEALSAL